MKRILAVAAAAALALFGLVLPAATASAAGDGSAISHVTASWSGTVIRLRFDYDTSAYARVDVSAGGTVVASKVLPPDDVFSTSISFRPAVGRWSVPLTVSTTSCDAADPADPATTCTTSTAYRETVTDPTRGVKKGEVSAVALLGRLAVRQESHAGSYRRSRFRLWNDADRDGENTRAEVLKAESRKLVTISGGGVTTGKWISEYDGKTVTVAAKLAIDHLVPLAEAWRSGASGWSTEKREAYANDLGYGASLIAATTQARRSKGEKDAAGWLPSAKSYRCAYVRDYVAVKSRWRLSVDAAEKTALASSLSACASVGVVKPASPVISALVPKPKPKATPKPAPGGGSSSGSAYYANCAAVRTAGKAPLYRGQPGYATPRLDRDGDGVACE